MKRWLSEWFQLDKKEKFDAKQFFKMKTAIIAATIIIGLFCVEQIIDEPMYLVKKNIYGYNECLKDSVFYEAKGLAPIPKSHIVGRIFLSSYQQSSFNMPQVNMLDFIGMSILAWLLVKYINRATKFGFFGKPTLRPLLYSAAFCTAFFCTKILFYSLLTIYYRAAIPYQLDTNGYIGNGWLYAGMLLFAVTNIFQQARKLQEENDLTV